MAKLYWRVKRDGKWTWTPAIVFDRRPFGPNYTTVENYRSGEE